VGASVDVDLSFDNDLGVDLSGIPSSFSLDITHIPKIQVGVDKLNVKLDPITVEPLDVSVRLKEIPSIRTHIPALFTLGLSVLGYELLCAKLCGEAQVITEPYHPNPCEHCGQVSITPVPAPNPTPVPGKDVPK
jgi:hypothetical protein